MKGFGMVRLGLAIAGVLLAGTALAQGPGGGMGPGFGEHRPPMERALGGGGEHGRWWNNPKVIERLKLTDEQRKTFDGILLEHREKLIDLKAGVEKAELEMETLVGADQPDEARILAQIDKVAQSRAELEKANARFLLAIRNKLTPEQWKLVQAFRANHSEERGDRERGDREHGDRDRGDRGWDRPGENRQGPGGQYHHQAPMPPAPPAAAPQAAPAPGAGTEQ
jgi:Spy/CpxP family protein refolding chaperone